MAGRLKDSPKIMALGQWSHREGVKTAVLALACGTPYSFTFRGICPPEPSPPPHSLSSRACPSHTNPERPSICISSLSKQILLTTLWGYKHR